jgi:hypothetical protein
MLTNSTRAEIKALYIVPYNDDDGGANYMHFVANATATHDERKALAQAQYQQEYGVEMDEPIYVDQVLIFDDNLKDVLKQMEALYA